MNSINNRKIVVGICARNEQAGITNTLNSIVKSAELAALSDWNLVICPNGCTDNTIPKVEEWKKENPKIPCVILIRTEGSLVEAQREIFNYKKKN
jgi:glycosyltransferase involved in cell wall biosynthesis